MSCGNTSATPLGSGSSACMGKAMIRTAGPERMVHLEQMLANDGHLAELSRRKRAEMTERSRG